MNVKTSHESCTCATIQRRDAPYHGTRTSRTFRIPSNQLTFRITQSSVVKTTTRSRDQPQSGPVNTCRSHVAGAVLGSVKAVSGAGSVNTLRAGQRADPRPEPDTMLVRYRERAVELPLQARGDVERGGGATADQVNDMELLDN